MAEIDHRSIAISTYNECWKLLETARSAEDDRNLLSLAFASRYHWLQVGGAQQRVVADWMVSRCAAAVGEGALSVKFATSSLEGLTVDAPAWMRASVHEGMARASAAVGDRDGRASHIAMARAALESEQSLEDRELIELQLSTV